MLMRLQQLLDTRVETVVGMAIPNTTKLRMNAHVEE